MQLQSQYLSSRQHLKVIFHVHPLWFLSANSWWTSPTHIIHLSHNNIDLVWHLYKYQKRYVFRYVIKMSFYIHIRAAIFYRDYLNTHTHRQQQHINIQDGNRKIFQVSISGDIRKEQVVLWDANKVWLVSDLNIVVDWLWSLRNCKHQWNYCQNWDIYSSALLLNFYGVSKGQCHTFKASTGLLSPTPTLTKFKEMQWPLGCLCFCKVTEAVKGVQK